MRTNSYRGKRINPNPVKIEVVDYVKTQRNSELQAVDRIVSTELVESLILSEQHPSIVRGPSKELVSSRPLRWLNLKVERHLVFPGERLDQDQSDYVVELATGTSVASGWRADESNRLVRYVKRPGDLNFYPPGRLPRVAPETDTHLIASVLDGRYVRMVREEASDIPNIALAPRTGFRDQAIASLLGLLAEEAHAGGPSGMLYVEHLTHALTIRLLGLKGASAGLSSQYVLPNASLNRVLQRMREELSNDLDLATLANESGYSKNHFLRMFRGSMGCTPYHYLLTLRVQRAQELMKNRSLRIIDIAVACGFSSHSQFTRVYRKMTGTPPSADRREHHGE